MKSPRGECVKMHMMHLNVNKWVRTYSVLLTIQTFGCEFVKDLKIAKW